MEGLPAILAEDGDTALHCRRPPGVQWRACLAILADEGIWIALQEASR